MTAKMMSAPGTVTDMTGYTQFASKTFSFTWKISKCFSRPHLLPAKITSPDFKDHCGNSWALEIHPNKNEIFFGLHQSCQDELQVIAKISFLDSNLSVKETLMVKSLMPAASFVSRTIPFKFLDDLESVLKDGTVQILCKVWTQYLEQCETSLLPPEESATNDFEFFLNNEILSDFTIVVDTREYHAHKFILAARSPVFLAMLTVDMVESTENRVTITDFSADVVEGMLKFIYTNRLPYIRNNTAGDYLNIAHRYDIKGLVGGMERLLIKILRTHNAVDFWKAATLYDARGLLNEVGVLINKNYVAVTRSVGFANLGGEELNAFCKFAIEATKIILGQPATASKCPSTIFQS